MELYSLSESEANTFTLNIMHLPELQCEGAGDRVLKDFQMFTRVFIPDNPGLLREAEAAVSPLGSGKQLGV